MKKVSRGPTLKDSLLLLLRRYKRSVPIGERDDPSPTLVSNLIRKIRLSEGEDLDLSTSDWTLIEEAWEALSGPVGEVYLVASPRERHYLPSVSEGEGTETLATYRKLRPFGLTDGQIRGLLEEVIEE